MTGSIINVSIEDIYLCLDEEMQKDSQDIDTELVDYCIDLLDKIQKDSNEIKT
ncbi:MAG: hypothetical protein LBB91_03850 [Clostridiales bacterium]|jgi:hypothetical protein|nr:hypothetical protein [Clostridiales bacterium]